MFTLLAIYRKSSSSFRDVSLRNIEHVFPDNTPEESEILLEKFYRSFSRFIVDTARFSTLDEKWIRTHVDVSNDSDYRMISNRDSSKGILVASGHLGSIEIQALVAPFLGRKFSFVARSLKQKKLNGWWNSLRERHGNQVIARKGAVGSVLENINSGIDTAILIDQNVRNEYAVFVDWFDRPASTTFAVGHIAIETRCPVVVSAISYIGNEKYRITEREVALADIYSDETLARDDRVRAVIARVSTEYQKLILDNPHEWFWMHRRWKTTPEGQVEDFYTKLN